MSKVSELKNYVSKEELKDGDVLIFKSKGNIVERDFSKARDGSGLKRVMVFMVELPDGQVKEMMPNKTSLGLLSAEYGDDTELWVDKRAKVSFVDQMSFGKKMKVLLLEPTKDISF